MSSLKTLFVVALLAAVGYGVYTSLHTNKTSIEPQACTNQYLTGPPSITLQSGGTRSTNSLFPPKMGNQLPSDNQPRQPQIGIPATSTAMAPKATSLAPKFNPPGPTTSSQVSKPNNTPQQNVQIGTQAHAGQPSKQNRSPVPVTQQLHVVQTSAETIDPLAMRSDNMSNFGSSTPRQQTLAPKNEFEAFMKLLEEKLATGKLADAHLSLSPWHNDPRLSKQEAERVEKLLDQLAGTVIYSREHLLEKPYEVKSGDTLEQIARLYKVPWQVLAKINGISDPNNLKPGQKLKVIYGPFDAIITLHKYELKLTLQGRYAGRFLIGIGRDGENLKGSFIVRGKTLNPTYYGPNQLVINAKDPNNPLGGRWIALDNNFGIHGTNNQQNIGNTGSQGCISLGKRDVEDIFDILSVGSRVVFRR